MLALLVPNLAQPHNIVFIAQENVQNLLCYRKDLEIVPFEQMECRAGLFGHTIHVCLLWLLSLCRQNACMLIMVTQAF